MAWSFLGPVKDARANAVTTYIGTGGKLAVYSSAYGQKLVEWSWTANMYAASSSGVMAMNAPTTNPVTPLANGTAAIARITQSNGTTVAVQDLTVGTSGADVNISNLNIVTTSPVTLSTDTLTEA